MTTREEILIGYQLISSISKSKGCIANISKLFQGTFKQTTDFEEILTLSEGSCRGIDTEILLIEEFISNYPDSDQINNGLQHFNESLSPKLVPDKNRAKAGAVTARATATAASVLADLDNTGKALEAFNWFITHTPNINDDITYNQQKINSYQLLLNAISLELQGIDIYTGGLIYDTFDKIKEQMKDRIYTADNLWNSVIHDTETTTWHDVFESIKQDYTDAENANELVSIGIYLEGEIPQLPLLWKYWYYE